MTRHRLLLLSFCLLLAGCDLFVEGYREATIPYETELLVEKSGAWRPIALSGDETEVLIDYGSQTALFDLQDRRFTVITSGDTVHNPVAFSPDGERILYQSGYSLGIMNRDGSGEKFLLRGDYVNRQYRPVAFSADGNRILLNTFLADNHLREWRAGLYDLEEGTYRHLTDGDSHVAGFTPRNNILYSRVIDGDSNVWIMNGDGSGKTQLTDDPRDSLPIAVAANGWTLLYVDVDSPTRIRTMSVEGTDPKTVLTGLRSMPTALSPGGRYIAYFEGASGGICGLCSVERAYLVKADGTMRTEIETGTYGPERIVAFFRDGARFLHSSRRDGSTRLLLSTITE